jgi:hypothetical protein
MFGATEAFERSGVLRAKSFADRPNPDTSENNEDHPMSPATAPRNPRPFELLRDRNQE